jgi:hypothetical protein
MNRIHPLLPYTIGADPELFMADSLGGLKASCGLIGGTKHNPQPMGLGDGFFIQEDNVAVEFNIPPAKSAEELAANLRKAITNISSNIKSMYGFEVVNLSAASFPEEELQADAAKEFGCDPDYNAWTFGAKNPRPKASDPNLRSCGGHIHVGYDLRGAQFAPDTLIRAMDLYLGVPSVLMDNGELRKQLYGKAGAFRRKPYGVEYRTLSNFWVFDDKLIEWVWNNTGRAINAVVARSVEIDSQEAIREAIDNNDKALAEKLAKVYNLEVLH